MSKNKVEIDVKVDDKGTTKKVGLESKKAAKGLNDTSKSARNADRNLKGAAQSSSNTTKNFSKMAQGTGGLVAAYATLAAQVFAVTAAFQFLRGAGDLAVLQAGQQAYASATGTAMRTLANDIIAATDAQITFQDASQAAAIGVAAGLSPDQLNRLGKAAKDASAVLGRDVTDSFNRLVRGVTKAEPELLDELGIILRLKDASEEYARALGKDASALTTFEKSQAVANNVLTQAEEKYGRILAITGVASNKYAKLAKAFDDLIIKVKEFAEKAAGPLAKLLTDTPELIGLALAGFLGPVLKAALPGLSNLGAAATAAGAAATVSFQNAKLEVEAYNRAVAAAGKDPKARAALGAQAKEGFLAGAAGRDSRKGTVLARLREGEQLSNKQLGALKRQLKAENGVFKGMKDKQRKIMISHVDDMLLANSTGTKKMSADYEKMSKSGKASFLKLKMNGTKALSGLAVAGQVAARGISLAFSALGFLGMAASVFMLVKGMMQQKDVTQEVAVESDLLGEKIQSLNKDLEHFVRVQKEINREGTATKTVIGNIGAAIGNFSPGDLKKITNELEDNIQVYNDIAKQEKEREQVLKRINELSEKRLVKGVSGRDTLMPKSDIQKVGEDRLKALEENLEINKKYVETTEKFKESLKKVADTLKMESDSKLASSKQGKAFLELYDRIQKNLPVTGEEIRNVMIGYKNLSDMTKESTRVAIENAKVGEDVRKKLFPKTELEVYVENLEKQLELETEILKSNALNAEEQKAVLEGIRSEIKLMKELRDQKIRHAKEQRGLEYGQLLSSPDAGEFPMLRKRREELNKIANLEMKLRQDREKLSLEKKVAFEDGKSPTAAQQEEIERITHEINMQEEAIRRANLALTDGAKIANGLAGTIESSMTSAFQGLITGTMTVKQAFASMAQSILKQLARIIAEMITMRILSSMFMGGTIGGGFGGDTVNSGGMGQESLARLTPGEFRTGGIAMPPKGYSVGGIAKGSTSGYPAILHGTEAVVPLPNGNSIPVEMKGSGATTNNNITVNVSSDGQTTTEGGQGMDMNKMGVAVAAAVQKELQNQKRSGGILNPYGVA